MIAAYILSAFAVGWMFARVTRKPEPPHGTLPKVWAEEFGEGYRICATYRRMPPQYAVIAAPTDGTPTDVVDVARAVMQRAITEQVGA